MGYGNGPLNGRDSYGKCFWRRYAQKCWSSGRHPFRSSHDHRFWSLWTPNLWTVGTVTKLMYIVGGQLHKVFKWFQLSYSCQFTFFLFPYCYVPGNDTVALPSTLLHFLLVQSVYRAKWHHTNEICQLQNMSLADLAPTTPEKMENCFLSLCIPEMVCPMLTQVFYRHSQQITHYEFICPFMK